MSRAANTPSSSSAISTRILDAGGMRFEVTSCGTGGKFTLYANRHLLLPHYDVVIVGCGTGSADTD